MTKYRTVEKSGQAGTAKRVFIVGALFACSFGVLVSRAVSFHLKNNEEIEKVALRQYRTAVHQSTRRGKIFDSAGREMAIDVTVESIYANPREIDEPVVMAEKLSKTLGVQRRKLLDRISSGRKFVWVKRRVSEKEANIVKGMGLKGIYSMRESSRTYPGKSLAAAVLGAVGFDGEPLGGIELSCNDLLAATKRSGDLKRDARGHLYLSPAGGDDKDSGIANVELTIDRTLQYIAERELANAVGKTSAKGGSVVVVDVDSGAVLAIANVPTFDPNEYDKFNVSNWKNRAISDAYEPGSTFKTVVVASALDAGVVTDKSVFDCENGSIKIGKNTISDSHPHKKLSVADILKVSSNIGAYKVGQKLGQKRTYEAIRSFGFGSETGIDLPGESAGLLSSHERWSELQFATIAFGQGISATPIQVAMAFAAIANGGTLLKPYIVKRIVSEKGNVVFSGGRQEVGRPISASASNLMTKLLTGVTKRGGTGTLAASLEYPVAGKTGTAQKADSRTGGYASGKYYSSFVGFAPADAPKIAVYVGIDEPRGGMYYGGQVAAPVFRNVVDATLHYLKVPGSLVVASNSLGEQAVSREAVEELVQIEAEGDGAKQVVRRDEKSFVLPDFRGMSMRGVLEAGSQAGIAWKFSGSGIAFRQHPSPGSVIYDGAECEVEFMPLM